MSEWKTIDSAPKDGTILVCSHHEIGVVFWRSDKWHLGGLMYFNKPTHWMPLPAPPDQAAVRTGGESPLPERDGEAVEAAKRIRKLYAEWIACEIDTPTQKEAYAAFAFQFAKHGDGICAALLSTPSREEVVEALSEIARQELSADMSVDDQLGGDFEGVYNHFVELARTALKSNPPRR